MGVAACRLFAYNRWMFESGKSSDKGGVGWYWGPSIYYVHPQGGWVGCRGVYSDVLWWVGGFSLDVHTHHVQRILKIYSSFSGASLVYS